MPREAGHGRGSRRVRRLFLKWGLDILELGAGRRDALPDGRGRRMPVNDGRRRSRSETGD